MAIHGLKFDYESVILFIVAVVVSTFITGNPVSQVLFTALVVILFFMKGLNIRPEKVKNNTHKWREVLVGTSLSYLLFPLAAIAFSYYLEGAAKLAVLVIGFSAAAIGPAIVWSGRAKAEPDTSTVLTVIGLIPAVPLLYLALEPVFGINPVIFAEQAFYFAVLPLLFGYFMKNFETRVFSDIKHHFSRVAMWLIMLVALVQFQAMMALRGASVIYELAVVFSFFILLTAVMSYLGYAFSRHIGIMERKSRSVSLFSGSKSFGVAILLGSQLGSMVLLYVLTYYFARQIVMEMIVKQSNNDLLFQNFDRDQLKPRLF